MIKAWLVFTVAEHMVHMDSFSFENFKIGEEAQKVSYSTLFLRRVMSGHVEGIQGNIGFVPEQVRDFFKKNYFVRSTSV